MEENLKNKLGFWTFVIIILFLAVGGFFFTKYTLNDKKSDKNNTNEVNYKIEKKKDYIYFTNEEVISESANITYKDVVINLNTQNVLTESLEKENKIYKENIKYIKDVDLITNDIVKYDNDGIYALTFRKYDTYEYGDYVSLVINDYNYSCFDLITYNKSKSYIFNVKTGKVLTTDEILNLYDVSLANIKDKIKELLTSEQSVSEEGVEIIKIDDTINNFDNYALYINEYGRLYISFLVKSNDVDYNKIMEVK